MATGITYAVKDGTLTDLKEFVMRSARAMTPLITMRDEPMDAPIPEQFEPSDYHANEAADARRRLQKLMDMSVPSISAAYEDEFAKRLASHRRCAEINALERQRYERMLEKVTAWQEPSPDHAHLKTFMLDQLTSSLQWDCSDEVNPLPERRNPAEWHAEQIAACRRDIEYHEKNYSEEVDRTRWRNRWIRTLRESLAEK